MSFVLRLGIFRSPIMILGLFCGSFQCLHAGVTEQNRKVINKVIPRHEEAIDKWMTTFYDNCDHENEFRQWLIDLGGEFGMEAVNKAGGGHGVCVFSGWDKVTNKNVLILWPATAYNAYLESSSIASIITVENRCPTNCDMNFYNQSANEATTATAAPLAISNARKMIEAYVPSGKAQFYWAFISPETISRLIESSTQMRFCLGSKDASFQHLRAIMAPVLANGTMDLDNAVYSDDNLMLGPNVFVP